MSHKKKHELQILGWREWVSLPGIGIKLMRAKVDTGAKTSSLHAEDCEEYESEGVERVKFQVTSAFGVFQCDCEVNDRRLVKSSSGHEEERPVVLTECVLLGMRWPIELTLTDRGTMRFPMLLGREAMAGRFAVDPGSSYLAGRQSRKKRRKSDSHSEHKKRP